MDRAHPIRRECGYTSTCGGADRLLGWTPVGTDQSMRKFKIKVARIEVASGRHAESQVCITFQIDGGTVNFRVPIRLKVSDYDDTEMVQAARNTLHQTFVELAAQSQHWKLSAKELRLLSGMSLRARTAS